MTFPALPRLDRIITRQVAGVSPGNDGFGNPLPGPITTVNVWAGRQDFTAEDQLRAAPVVVAVTDSRYYVRAGSWAVGDEFIDEDGVRRTVQGISVIGRGRFLELLARRIG